MNRNVVTEIDIEQLCWSSDAFDRLAELVAARETIDTLLAQAVKDCRSSAARTRVYDLTQRDGEVITRAVPVVGPVPWKDIAAVLGISRPTAYRKYGHD